MAPMPKFTVEARADRFQRRMTGPWTTRRSGMAMFRYRRRPAIEYVRLWVALHDLERSILRALHLR